MSGWGLAMGVGPPDNMIESTRRGWMATSDLTQMSELRDLIEEKVGGRDGDHQTSIPSLWLTRYSSPTAYDRDSVRRFNCSVTPAVCIVGQGQKEFLLGEEVCSYGPGHHLVASAQLPVSARVVGATPAKPYLAVRVHFELANLRSLIEEARLPPPPGGASQRGLYVSETGPALLDAVLRLVRLLKSPAEIPVLAPKIEREILFRLLLEGTSVVLHRVEQPGSQH